MDTVPRLLCSGLVLFWSFSVVTLGLLRCMGDTDGCDPSAVDNVFVVFAVAAGLYLLWRCWSGVSVGRFALEFGVCVIAVSILNRLL